MAYEVPDLGYAFDALEPHIDARTMEIHHDKHHATYVKNVNAALADSDLGNQSIEAWSRTLTACRKTCIPPSETMAEVMQTIRCSGPS